jgi:hypothetical protein
VEWHVQYLVGYGRDECGVSVQGQAERVALFENELLDFCGFGCLPVNPVSTASCEGDLAALRGRRELRYDIVHRAELKVHDGPSSEPHRNEECPAWPPQRPPHLTPSTSGNAAHATCLAPRVNIEARSHAPAAPGLCDTMRAAPVFVHFRGVP